MSALPADAVILALESSADQVSAAIWLADGRHWQEIHVARHGHAAMVTELARQVMNKAGVTAAGLTHIAAGRGPGSFTGIRVSLAAAKGFALASGAGGIGVSCLAAMAHVARIKLPDLAGNRLLATADTRRGSFFCQIFDPGLAAAPPIWDIAPEPGQQTPEDWQGVAVIGAGAAALAAAFPGRAMRVMPDMPPVDALQIADLAAHRLQTGLGVELLTPLYVAPAFLGPAPSGLPPSPVAGS